MVINVKPYRIPEIHKDELEKQTEQILAGGIIQPSTSQWNSPILVVSKKIDASCKMKWEVLDFRKIIHVTICDSFPIPVISDVFYSEIRNIFQLSTVLMDFGKFQ